MDHVISDLQRWLDIYEADPEEIKNRKAIERIEAAIKELQKYYTGG